MPGIHFKRANSTLNYTSIFVIINNEKKPG